VVIAAGGGKDPRSRQGESTLLLRLRSEKLLRGEKEHCGFQAHLLFILQL